MWRVPGGRKRGFIADARDHQATRTARHDEILWPTISPSAHCDLFRALFWSAPHLCHARSVSHSGQSGERVFCEGAGPVLLEHAGRIDVERHPTRSRRRSKSRHVRLLESAADARRHRGIFDAWTHQRGYDERTTRLERHRAADGTARPPAAQLRIMDAHAQKCDALFANERAPRLRSGHCPGCARERRRRLCTHHIVWSTLRRRRFRYFGLHCRFFEGWLGCG